MKKPATTQEAIAKLRWYCGQKEMCRQDILLKLAEWHIPENDYGDIVSLLEQHNFFHDKRYAMAFVHDKLRLNKWGKCKIRYHLRMKGINESVISDALNNIDQEEYLVILKHEIEKKNSEFRGKKNAVHRVMKSIIGKGFETDLVQKFFSS